MAGRELGRAASRRAARPRRAPAPGLRRGLPGPAHGRIAAAQPVAAQAPDAGLSAVRLPLQGGRAKDLSARLVAHGGRGRLPRRARDPGARRVSPGRTHRPHHGAADARRGAELRADAPLSPRPGCRAPAPRPIPRTQERPVTPLRITAHMLQPVAFHPAEGLSIDSPLLYAVQLEERGEQFFRPRGNDEIGAATAEPHPNMPLAVHRAGGLWCYAASLAELHGWHGTELLHTNKRLDESAAFALTERGGLRRGRGKVNLGSGEFKAYHIPLYTEVVERLVWYACGDAAEVRRLLTTHVRGLGKKRNSGHGAVAEWTVEEVGMPADRWMWRPNGEPARAIPTRMLDDWTGETAWLGFRPPYWLAANQTWCAAPATSRAMEG